MTRTLLRKLSVILGLQLLFILLLAAPNMASNMNAGPPLKAQVVQAKKANPRNNTWVVSAVLLEEPHVPKSGYYKASDFKKGTVVSFECVNERKSFKPSEMIKVRWQQYGAMGPDGPVGGLSWKYAK